MGSETPLCDAHLAHLNTFDGRKIGIPDSTLDLCRTLELTLRRRGALLRECDDELSAYMSDYKDLRERIERELGSK